MLCSLSKTVYWDFVKMVGKDEFTTYRTFWIFVEQVVEKGEFPSHQIFFMFVEQEVEFPSMPDDELDELAYSVVRRLPGSWVPFYYMGGLLTLPLLLQHAVVFIRIACPAR